MLNVVECKSISEIADGYDVFIVDQWGVLHDGLTGYPEARKSLRYLRGRGKIIALLTNSGKSADRNIQRLVMFGFEEESFDLILTSGDLAIESINEKCKHDKIFLVDYTLKGDIRAKLKHNAFVGVVDEADFILLSGWDESSMRWDDYEPIFENAIRLGIPMLCSNPDTIGFFKGKIELGPGAIATRFSKMGGSVTYFGKPDKEIFESCLARVGRRDKARAVVIGDSYATDICGAANSKIDSLLIEMGLHQNEFARGSVASAIQLLSASFSNSTVYPKYVMDKFRVTDED